MTIETHCKLSICYTEGMRTCMMKEECEYQYLFAGENWCGLEWNYKPPQDLSQDRESNSKLCHLSSPNSDKEGRSFDIPPILLPTPQIPLDLPLSEKIRLLNERRKPIM